VRASRFVFAIATLVLAFPALAAAQSAAADESVAPAPIAPPSSGLAAKTLRARSTDGPGDEEAKADFQNARLLPDGSPLHFAGRYGSITLYGFGEVDYLHDSTQSFGIAANNFPLARRHTPRGDDAQSMGTDCNSRLGLRLETSESRSIGAAFVTELGPSWEPGDGGRYLCEGGKVRDFYVGLRSPILDVLIGRYYSLFGWGGKGFFPNTAAFLGVPAQVYRLEPQVRLSHIFRRAPGDIEIAGSFSGAPQYVSGAGEATFGLRYTFNWWRGASAQGSGPPVAAPLQVGIARVHRRFSVSDFVENPKINDIGYGDGWSVNVFAPVIPARGDDLGNALSFILEETWGTGLSDMYTGLTGGVLFPALPTARVDPNNPLPVYRPNIANGIVTFNADRRLVSIDWKTFLIGAQYHLPFARGRRVWLSANYSRTHSDNAQANTPLPGWGGLFTKADYFDGNVFVGPLRALQVALSYQVTRQTFADSVSATNRRVQVGVTYFF
jgi:hypothetical protein